MKLFIVFCESDEGVEYYRVVKANSRLELAQDMINNTQSWVQFLEDTYVTKSDDDSELTSLFDLITTWNVDAVNLLLAIDQSLGILKAEGCYTWIEEVEQIYTVGEN